MAAVLWSFAGGTGCLRLSLSPATRQQRPAETSTPNWPPWPCTREYAQRTCSHHTDNTRESPPPTPSSHVPNGGERWRWREEPGASFLGSACESVWVCNTMCFRLQVAALTTKRLCSVCPLLLCSHARLRCMCTCNRCTFCLCQNFLNSELLQRVRAKLYTVLLRRS